MTEQSLPETQIPTVKSAEWRRWLWTLAPGLGLVAGLAYGIGMFIAHTIDDDPDFGPGSVAAGQSRAVAMAAQLVFREIETHKWVANDPFFQPSWALDDMPAYQQGIVAAMARFVDGTNEMAARGGATDVNLDRAAGYLKYPGNVWMFDPSTSWAPTASSEKQYRSAARNLVLYNERIASGDALFDRRPEALVAFLKRIGGDLDLVAANLDAHMTAHHSALLDTQADDVFYTAKGRLYGHSLVLRELGRDFAATLGQGELTAAWSTALEAMHHAAALEPLVVLNGAADATLLPSHLAAQGYYLLRARGQLAAMVARLEH